MPNLCRGSCRCENSKPRALSTCGFSASYLRNFDDDLQCVRVRRMTEGLIRIEHAIECEAVRDEALWIEAAGAHGLHQHRRADCIDKPRSDADIAVPQRFKMKVCFNAMHAHVGDD